MKKEEEEREKIRMADIRRPSLLFYLTEYSTSIKEGGEREKRGWKETVPKRFRRIHDVLPFLP